jgi:hypothetical protein
VAAAAALIMFVTMREPPNEPKPRPSAAQAVASQQLQPPQVMPVTRLSPDDLAAFMGQAPMPSVATGQIKIHRVAQSEERIGDLDTTKLFYDVQLGWGGHVGALAFTFDSTGVEMRLGDWVRVNGVDLYVARLKDARGAPATMVSYDGPGDRGWVFYAPKLTERDLIDLVAYHLLDDVGAR